MELFALTEPSWQRGPLRQFSNLLCSQATTIAQSHDLFEQTAKSFNCQAEIQLMQQFSRQLKNASSDVNAAFVQNAALFQQNRANATKNAMTAYSQLFMRLGGDYLQQATNLRR